MKTAGAFKLFACAMLLVSLLGSGRIARSEDYYDGDEPDLATAEDDNPAPAPKRKTVRIYSPKVRQAAAQEDVTPPYPDDDKAPAQLDDAKQPAAQQGPAAKGSCDNCGDCDAGCDTDCCCMCGPPGQFWFRDEYLAWWTAGANIPALITTSPVGTPPGVLGEPGTRILFGDQEVNNGYRPGNRVTGGLWLDCCHTVGIQADYFALGQANEGYLALGSQYPVLARPFFNPVTGDESSELVNVPGIVAGNVSAWASSEFQGGGIALRHNWCCEEYCNSCCNNSRCNDGCGQHCRRIDWIAGYRFYRMDDNVTVRETLTSTNPGGPIAQGTTFDIFDSFTTHNEFHGADLGLEASWYKNRWSLDVLGKVAIGNNQTTVTINGQTTTTVPGQASNIYTGGLLALPTNIGTYTRNQFTAIPSIEARVGYQLTCHWRAYAGYTAIFWGDVARAGDQIDLVVNPSQLPPGTLQGPARPAFAFHDSNFWAQGINVGLELRF